MQSLLYVLQINQIKMLCWCLAFKLVCANMLNNVNQQMALFKLITSI